MNGRWQGLWREWRSALFLLIGIVIFRTGYADWYVVPTGSMQPTIVEGDRVLVNKHAFGFWLPFADTSVARWGAPERNDIVVFIEPESKVRMIKRVIAVAGDTVELRGNKLWLNGREAHYAVTNRDETRLVAEEDAGRAHAVQFVRRPFPVNDFGPYTVPEGSIFVMGDNRNNSRDSRFYGAIPLTTVVGRATRVLASLDPEEFHLPRAERWWKALR